MYTRLALWGALGHEEGYTAWQGSGFYEEAKVSKMKQRRGILLSVMVFLFLAWNGAEVVRAAKAQETVPIVDEEKYIPLDLSQKDPFDNGTAATDEKVPVAEPKVPPQDDQTWQGDGSVIVRLGPANIQTFIIPSAQSLSQSFVRLNGVDLTDPGMIDEFARVNYCPVFAKYYRDEFRWRHARKAIRQLINRNLESYPEHFVVNGRLPLGRYDFSEHAFILPPENRLDRVGRFTLKFPWPDGCFPAKATQIIPMEYTISLDNPVTLSKIPVATMFAEFVSREMDRRENFTRSAYISFLIRINDFSLSQRSYEVKADARATLLSLRFYADPGRTILIYDYRPPSNNF